MAAMLRRFEALATRRPRSVVAALLLITVGLAALATTNEFEVDLSQLGSEDSSAVQAMERLRTEFGDPRAAVQIVLDAGPGGDVLHAEGFAAIASAERTARAALGEAIRTDASGEPELMSLRALLEQAPAGVAADAGGLGAAVAQAIVANPQAAGLVSDDLDVTAGSARATVVLALLDPELDRAARSDAASRVVDAFAATPDALPAGVEVAVFSDGRFVDGLLDAIRAEVPRLFALALAIVLAILALLYRSIFDVLVGFAGLIATVVWTFGLVALLGPNNLAWTGPLTQLAVIVPVLLVGLGIDYSVHLTTRYREQRAAGQAPVDAAGRALRTVGAALVLATVATAVGFASIAAAPLAMLADFGVFVAIGVVCAFAIMGSLVPAARVLRDGRRAAGAPDATHPAGGADGSGRGGAAPVAGELHLGGLMDWPHRLAVRRPWAGLAVAAVLAVGSLVAATGLEVEFDRDDFVPEGSDVAASLRHQADLFGGGVTESTFVLVDGDVTDVEVANAVLRAQSQVGTLDQVRSVGGTPQVVSAFTLAATAANALPGSGVLEPDGDGFAPGTDLGALFDRLRSGPGGSRLGQLLPPGEQTAVVQIRTTAGDAGADRLEQEVAAAFSPVVDAGAEVTVTSEPIIVAEMSRDLSAFQARAIAATLLVVLLLVAGYYGVTHRRPLLGVIALVPATISASLVVGFMWLLGISFNVLTATLTAIAVGIGVPYGVHLVNRFVEDLGEFEPDAAISRTLASTGGALVGSALTTFAAFAVLAFSGLPPIRSLGLLGGAGIAFALLAAVLVEPGALVAWARRRPLPTGGPQEPRPGSTAANISGPRPSSRAAATRVPPNSTAAP